MNEEKRIFVTGIRKDESKGHYLARVLRTQEGITKAKYDKNMHIINLTYDPKAFCLDDLNKYAYYSECSFIYRDEEVEQEIRKLVKEQYIKKLLIVEIVVVCLSFLALLIALVRGNSPLRIEVAVFALSVLAYAFTWFKYARKKAAK